MHPPNRNPTELYYSRSALLTQEARDRRLLRRQRRAARSPRSPRGDRLATTLARMGAAWERARGPFFGA